MINGIWNEPDKVRVLFKWKQTEWDTDLIVKAAPWGEYAMQFKAWRLDGTLEFTGWMKFDSCLEVHLNVLHFCGDEDSDDFAKLLAAIRAKYHEVNPAHCQCPLHEGKP